MFAQSSKLIHDSEFNEFCSLYEMVVNLSKNKETFKNYEFEARLGNFLNVEGRTYFNSDMKFKEFNNVMQTLLTYVNSQTSSSLQMNESISLEVGMQIKEIISDQEQTSPVGNYRADMGNQNIRVIINGLDNIREYCKLNTVSPRKNDKEYLVYMKN